MRELFRKKLSDLSDEILKMGSMVEEELQLALKALDELDLDLAHQVYEHDRAINERRFALEDRCTALICTQQPIARDLRAIIAVMNMIVDLERMGDQAKGIAKVIPHITKHPNQAKPPALELMADMVLDMHRQGMAAYAKRDVDLAKWVAAQDDEVDEYYKDVFGWVMHKMAETDVETKVEVHYEMLRVARELERFGDLATNVAERVVYIATGQLQEENVEPEAVMIAALAG